MQVVVTPISLQSYFQNITVNL